MASEYENFRLETRGGIRYARVEGPSYHVTRDEVRAREKILIRARDVLPFHAEAMAPPIFLLDQAFLPPQRTMPGAGWLVAESLDFNPQSADLPGDPFGSDDEAGSNTYNEFYHCDISYRPWLESDEEGRNQQDPLSFLEISKSAAGQFLSIPPANTSIEETDSLGRLPDGETSNSPPQEVNKDLQMGFVIQVPTVEYVLTWPLVLNPPFNVLERAMGKVNDAELPLFDDSPPETVLFMGYSAKRKYVWDGVSGRSQPWELQYRFSKRAINRLGGSMEDDDESRVFGWNHEFSPTKGDWVRIILANGRPPHDEENLLSLFLIQIPAPQLGSAFSSAFSDEFA